VKTLTFLIVEIDPRVDHVHGWVNAFSNASLTRDMLRTDAAFAAEQFQLWNANRTGKSGKVVDFKLY